MPDAVYNGYVGRGVEIIARPPGVPLTVYLEYWSAEAEKVLRASRAPIVALRPSWKGGLEFLPGFGGQIRSLSIGTANIADLSPVAGLAKLEDLSLACPTESLDFTALEALRECRLRHPATPGNLAACGKLTGLGLYELPVRDLGELASLPNLRWLHLVQLQRLAALPRFASPALEELEIVALKQVRSIAALPRNASLRTLTVAHCRQIADVERIRACASLESIRILDGPELPSFEWVRTLRALREFGLEGTDVHADPASIAPFVRLPELRALRLFSGTSTVTDLERLGEAGRLEELAISRAPNLLSLRFLEDLKHLRFLRITRTRIVDGDLSVLLDLPDLERVTIQPYLKRYSPDAAQIDAVISARHPNRPDEAAGMNAVVDNLRAVAGRSADPSAQAELEARRGLAETRYEELVQVMGSEQALFRAATQAAQREVRERKLADRFDVIVTLAGHRVHVTGRVVGGRAHVEGLRPAGA